MIFVICSMQSLIIKTNVLIVQKIAQNIKFEMDEISILWNEKHTELDIDEQSNLNYIIFHLEKGLLKLQEVTQENDVGQEPSIICLDE